MKKVLVLCTGNSCRSQMAEGFLHNHGVDVKSAGLESHGLNPYAVQVMREVNIDISTNISRKIDTLNLSSFDILITVCDHARDTCPNIPDIKTNIHKSFRDPAIFNGSEQEKLLIYRHVRDQINVFCQQLIRQDYNLI